jgi:PBSX family phage terminase large subunit
MLIDINPDVFNDVYLPYLDNRDRYLAFWGSRGGGKSDFIAQRIIIDMIRCDFFRPVLIRKTYESIKDSQFQAIVDYIVDWGLEHLFDITTSPLKIVYRGNRKNYLTARGIDKKSKLKSLKDPTFLWFEEIIGDDSGDITEEEFTTVDNSIRTQKADYIQTVLSFNPENTEHWIFKKWFDHKDQTSFKKTYKVQNEKTEQWFEVTFHSIHSTWMDNKFLPDQYGADLKLSNQHDPVMYRVSYLGLWTDVPPERPYMQAFDINRHVSSEAVFMPELDIYLSFDFNVDNCACSVSQRTHSFIHFIDEVIGKDVFDLCAKIKAKYYEKLTTCFVTGDSSGKNRSALVGDNKTAFLLIKKELNLSKRQFRVKTNPKHKENRILCNAILLKVPNVYFHPKNCIKTIYDMNYVECKPDGSIIKEDRSKTNQLADLLDCVRYTFNTFDQKRVKLK